jgi:uncharacterized membrane protein
VRGHLDLQRTLVATIACALVALLIPWDPIQVLAAIPLCLFLPGYAIVSLVLAGRELSRAQTVVFSLACSFAALALGVLLLNYLPGGIRGITWALFIVILVAACCRGAALRRPPPSRRHPKGPRLRLRRRDLALLISGLLIGAIAIGLAQVAVPAKKAEGFTALWMLLAKDGGSGLRVGVLSSEQEEGDYVLRIDGAGAQPDESRFRLAPGEERVFQVPVTTTQAGKTRVAASLYRATKPSKLYRRVTAWVES